MPLVQKDSSRTVKNESKVEELQVEQLQDELENTRNSEPGKIDIEHE